MDVVRHENHCPKFELPTLDEVPSLLFEHYVIIRNRDELFVAEAFRICNVREVWIALLAVLSNY